MPVIGRIKKLWYLHTTECYTAGKTNPSTWLNSKTTMREQKEATEDHTHFKTHKTTLCPAQEYKTCACKCTCMCKNTEAWLEEYTSTKDTRWKRSDANVPQH